MTREETQRLLVVLGTAYPMYIKNMNSGDKTNLINLYTVMFGEYPVELMMAALNLYIRNNEYPPTIAGLQKQVDLLTHSEDAPAELWGLMLKAISNSLYHASEEFEKLPQVCKDWLHSPSQLRELGLVDSSKVATVIRGQFFNSIGCFQDRERAEKVYRKSCV